MLHSSLSLIWASVSQAGMLKPLWVDPTCPPATNGTQAPSSRSLMQRRWTIGMWGRQSPVSRPVCWSVCKIYSTYVVFSSKLYCGWSCVMAPGSKHVPVQCVSRRWARRRHVCEAMGVRATCQRLTLLCFMKNINCLSVRSIQVYKCISG